MQKRKIEDSKIWEAYSRLMSGESLTKVSSGVGIGLDRGTLRKYIEKVVVPNLNLTEREKLEQVIIGFTVDETFEFFMKKPRAFGTDTATVKRKFEAFARKKGSREAAIEALKGTAQKRQSPRQVGTERGEG